MMNAATVKTLVDACGLSRRDAANFLGVNERNVGNWFSGQFQPSASHLGKLTELLDMVMDKVDEVAETMNEHDDLPVVIIRYDAASDVPDGLPLGAHHAIVRGVFAVDCERVHVMEFDAENYGAWLAAAGVSDSVENRQKWARDMFEIDALIA